MLDTKHRGLAGGRNLKLVHAYHRSSSLDPERPGAMPQRLERRSQPIPFRRYPGSPRLDLPLTAVFPDITKDPGTTDLELASRLLESSLALAGWKRKDEACFGLRCVPSAGNLHPLETYLVASGLEDGAEGEPCGGAGIYHYSPFDHALERRRWLPAAVWKSLRSSCPGASMFIALSAIYWRCAWKYGERAFRLCHLDAGHAVAALDASAALEKRCIRWVDVDCQDLGRLLGLGTIDDPESEDAVCLLALEPLDEPALGHPWRPGDAVLRDLAQAPLEGEPSRISEQPRQWSRILSVARATRQIRAGRTALGHTGPPVGGAAWPRAILRQRRSRSLYADRSLSRRDFFELIAPLAGEATGTRIPSRESLAVLLFVHRVDGFEPGLYAVLNREPAVDRVATELRMNFRQDFDWHETPAHGRGWRLVSLSHGDARRAAIHLSGDQPAAGDGAFTAILLGRFASMRRDGACVYRHLHWQAGALGHRLYLEAEARNLGATGLGGFFDDRLATLLDLNHNAEHPTAADWRPLYLLAIGHRSSDDPELEPPYAHRGSNAEPAPASRGGWTQRG